MFRPLRRKSNAISDRNAREVLLRGRRGILAVNGDDGYPLALPVNYVFDANANHIYFHGAKAGHKVDSLRRDDRVCFTVIGEDIRVEGEWAPYVRSTVVFGRCHLVGDRDLTVEKVRELALKYYPDPAEAEAEVAKGAAAAQLYQVDIEHLCGKQIQER